MSKPSTELPPATDPAKKATNEEDTPTAATPVNGKSDIVAIAATIGAVGVVTAIVDLALIPGMVIGVAAALAPGVAPRLGERLEPLFESTVKGAIKLTRKARSAMAEAHERMSDLTAEIDAEELSDAGAGIKAVA